MGECRSIFLIIEMDSTAVGYVQLRCRHTPAAIISQKPMGIARIYARKEWIGKTVGGRLMEASLREAEHAGCDVVWLGVWERNPRGIAFSRKWGFKQICTQTFQLGDDSQNDWVMARRVDMLK